MKNPERICIWDRYPNLKKLTLTMKIILILAFVGLIPVSASVYSQQTKMSFSMTDKSMKEVLDLIEETTDFRFFYNENFTNLNQIVSIEANDNRVEEILDKLLAASDVTYKVLENNLVVISPKALLQLQKVTGSVKDAGTGDPMPGVNVRIEGTNTGTVTNADGTFSLEVPTENSVLIFSFIGYLSERVSIDGRSVVDIALVGDIQNLEEVVVIGYGVQQKASVTGSVAAVKGEDLLKTQTPDVMNSLTGRMAGVMINSRTGEPGRENIDIFIRGRSTTGASNPLIIIDGVERPDLSRINPNDIENISVLKDASAAIYGARAANGVILVTTKRGQAGPAVFSFSYNQGFSQPTRNPKMGDAFTFASIHNEGIDIDGGDPNNKYSDDELSLFRQGTQEGYTTTDWYDTMIKDYTPQSRLNLSVSGGTDNLSYFLSLGKMGQDGHFRYGSTRIDRYNFRSNVTVKATEYLKVGLDVAGLFNDIHLPGNPDARGIYSHMYLYLPQWTLFNPGTKLPMGNRDNQSLINWVSDAGGSQDENYKAAQSKLHFELDIPWVKGLQLSGSGNYDASYNHTKYFKTPSYVYRYEDATDTYLRERAGGDTPALAQLTERFDQITTMTLNAIVRYNKQIGLHKIGLMAGYEQMEYKANYTISGRTDFLSTAIPELFAGSSDRTKWTADGSALENSRSNYFGRATYDYAGKYMAEFIYRADGSPNFPENKRWGHFPGISLGWRVSEETFMDNITAVDNLKLRVSYGQMGNDSISPFQHYMNYTYGTGAANTYVIGGSDVQTLLSGVSPNSKVTWEVAKTFNVGIDFSLWNGLLGAEIDIFNTRRSNILMRRTVVVPDYTGLRLPMENFGEVKNHGFEVLLTHRYKISNNLTYSLTGTYAFARNEVTVADEAPAALPYQYKKGKAIGPDVLFYEAIGIYSDLDEINNTPHMDGAKPGDIIYRDLSGDGLIDSRDRKRLDQSYTPEIVYSLSGTLNYRNLDFSFMLQGQENAQTYVFDYEPNAGETPQPYFAVLSSTLGNFVQWRADGRWTPDNTEGVTMPRASNTNFNNNTNPSTHWILDAGFLRLKSLELGYTIPSKILEKARIKSLRAYVSGYNLFLIYDHMKDVGFDPETTDFWYYPPQRTYNFGFNLTF